MLTPCKGGAAGSHHVQRIIFLRDWVGDGKSNPDLHQVTRLGIWISTVVVQIHLDHQDDRLPNFVTHLRTELSTS